MFVAIPLVVLLSASCPGQAAAAASSAYQALDYTGALAAVVNVELCSDGNADELAEAFRWRAQAHAAQRNTEGAVDAFTWVATVSPVYVLDPMLAPKVHALFSQGRARVKEEKSVFARVTSRRGEQLALEVFDPMAAVSSVRVSWVGGTTAAARASGAQWAVTIPKDVTAVTLRVDRPGAPQWTSREIAVAVAVALLVPRSERSVEPAVAAAQSRSSPVEVWPWAVGVGAGVVIAVAVGVGVSASNARFNGTLGRLELPPR